MKGKYQIFSLLQKPGLKQEGARWFHEKWNIPEEAYLESMEESLREHGPVPQWYLALDEEQIIGGLGIIENDFHNRKDLSPNVCAVYVEFNLMHENRFLRELFWNGPAGTWPGGESAHYIC